MLILRDSAPSVKPVSFCTCGDNCEFCPSCRTEASPADLIMPCPDCGKRLHCYFDHVTGEEFFCPDCDRFSPAA